MKKLKLFLMSHTHFEIDKKIQGVQYWQKFNTGGPKIFTLDFLGKLEKVMIIWIFRFLVAVKVSMIGNNTT